MLFKLINDFHTQWSQVHEPKEIAMLLNKLIQYCEHISCRKSPSWKKEDFPDWNSIATITKSLPTPLLLLNEESAERRELASNDMQKFYKHWLVDHIINSDYEFLDYLSIKKQQRAVV